MSDIDIDIAIENFRKKHGKKADLALKQLSKLNYFVQAVNSDIGQELLKDDIMRLEDLATKMWNESANSQELAEFRYLKLRVAKVTERLDSYVKQTQEIIGDRKKEGA